MSNNQAIAVGAVTVVAVAAATVWLSALIIGRSDSLVSHMNHIADNQQRRDRAR